jgi:hypothetical protein
MSVSSSTLFTGYCPPGFFPPLHGVGHDLVQLVGRFLHGTNRSHDSGGFRHWLSLADLAEQQTGGFGHRGIDGGKAAVLHSRLNRAFQVVW